MKEDTVVYSIVLLAIFILIFFGIGIIHQWKIQYEERMHRYKIEEIKTTAQYGCAEQLLERLKK